MLLGTLCLVSRLRNSWPRTLLIRRVMDRDWLLLVSIGTRPMMAFGVCVLVVCSVLTFWVRVRTSMHVVCRELVGLVRLGVRTFVVHLRKVVY